MLGTGDSSGVYPSVVRYRENGVEVGKKAKDSMGPGKIVESKRLLGKQFNDPDIQQEIANKFFPFEIVKDESGKVMIKTQVEHGKGKNRTYEDKVVYPYEVSSEILKSFKNMICNEFL